MFFMNILDFDFIARVEGRGGEGLGMQEDAKN